ncbi:hypothetical protein Syun_020544 [Stephania yunnanensis]|uniref:Uncharacterized protein n=1 Tax=Stephania yunnanensis TaxID=152371 RepID=A0AAP0IFX1_9MAGN
MEDKFDTLRVEVKELMKRILSSVDEEAFMAVILDDEPLIACYDIFRDAAKEMKKTLPTKEVIAIFDNIANGLQAVVDESLLIMKLMKMVVVCVEVEIWERQQTADEVLDRGDPDKVAQNPLAPTSTGICTRPSQKAKWRVQLRESEPMSTSANFVFRQEFPHSSHQRCLILQVRCGCSEMGGASSANGARGGAPAAADERRDTCEDRGRTAAAVATSQHRRRCSSGGPARALQQNGGPATRRLRVGWCLLWTSRRGNNTSELDSARRRERERAGGEKGDGGEARERPGVTGGMTGVRDGSENGSERKSDGNEERE